MAPDKTKGPLTTLIFLELDIVSFKMCLQHIKQTKLHADMAQWMGSGARPYPRRSRTKWELLSLIGLLNHSATVVRPGWAFTRNLINASTTVQSLEHHICLNSAARQDLSWFHNFLRSWNGVVLSDIQPHLTQSYPMPQVQSTKISGSSFLGLPVRFQCFLSNETGKGC